MKMYAIIIENDPLSEDEKDEIKLALELGELAGRSFKVRSIVPVRQEETDPVDRPVSSDRRPYHLCTYCGRNEVEFPDDDLCSWCREDLENV